MKKNNTRDFRKKSIKRHDDFTSSIGHNACEMLRVIERNIRQAQARKEKLHEELAFLNRCIEWNAQRCNETLSDFVGNTQIDELDSSLLNEYYKLKEYVDYIDSLI